MVIFVENSKLRFFGKMRSFGIFLEMIGAGFTMVTSKVMKS